MGRLHRAQVLLEQEQYQRLRRLAEARSLKEGKRVSVSQVIRELLRDALDRETQMEMESRTALQSLFALGETVAGRHPVSLPEDWLDLDREEHDDARLRDISAGH